ncbi:MAG: tRNA lysidine(34) synthetase TilS [Candidatus Zixiibacteriota bacterium]
MNPVDTDINRVIIPVIDPDDRVVVAVRRYFDEYGWPPHRSRILVALSGGADSVTLLTVMQAMTAEHEWRLGAAHVNYHLRGDESDSDEAFCRELCARWGIPLHVHHVHRPTERSVNVQAWARTERYAFFEQLMALERFDLTAVGHSLDDRAESVAAALIEARGTFALSGIPPIRDRIIRPLYGVPRQEMPEFLRRYGLEHRHDSSNKSENYLRNRIRHMHLPQWEEANPSIRPGLARLGEQLWRQEVYLQSNAEHILDEAKVATGASFVSLKADVLSHVDRALDPFILRLMIRMAGFSTVPTSDTVDRFTELRQRCHSGRVEQGDIWIERSKNIITLRRLSNRDAPSADSVRVAPGESVVFGSITLNANLVGAMPVQPRDDHREATLDWNCLSGPLVLRGWHPGDRYQPIGLRGHKALADLFADRGVPRGRRSSTAILTDSQGIVWPIGHPIADRVKITADTQSVLHLKVGRL